MDSETTQRRIVREALNTHGLAGNHINNGSITRFQKFRAIFQLLSRTTINFFLQLSKLASNVSCVTIQYRGIPSTDLTWMVQDDHLSSEASCFHWCLTDTFLTLKPTLSPGRASLKASCLHLAHRDSANTTNFVDIL
uniref:Uncharacterized protein n=1 Tax=Oryctolagus cuniculus TaxID=9986 RepID=A0A5F9DKM0_RABIT